MSPPSAAAPTIKTPANATCAASSCCSIEDFANAWQILDEFFGWFAR